MRSTVPKDTAALEGVETREWLESLDYVLQSGGPVRVGRLLRELSDHARRHGGTTRSNRASSRRCRCRTITASSSR